MQTVHKNRRENARKGNECGADGIGNDDAALEAVRAYSKTWTVLLHRMPTNACFANTARGAHPAGVVVAVSSMNPKT